MMRRCKHCGEEYINHRQSRFGGGFCQIEFEEEGPPTECFFCDEGWTRVKRDGRFTGRDTCNLDDDFQHIHPESE